MYNFNEYICQIVWPINLTQFTFSFQISNFNLDMECKHAYPAFLFPKGLGNHLDGQVSFDETRRSIQTVCQIGSWMERWKPNCYFTYFQYSQLIYCEWHDTIEIYCTRKAYLLLTIIIKKYYQVHTWPTFINLKKFP